MTMSSQKPRPQQQQEQRQIEPVPSHLESAQAKLVYIYLEATGGATVDDLRETLRMKKLSILSILNTLSSTGVVEQDGNRYVTTS